MARSLDGLIGHLVDQIALCGKHGESDSLPHVVHVRATCALHVPILKLCFFLFFFFRLYFVPLIAAYASRKLKFFGGV